MCLETLRWLVQESTSSIISKTHSYQKILIRQQLPLTLSAFARICSIHWHMCMLSAFLWDRFKSWFHHSNGRAESWRVCVLKGWLLMFVFSITTGHPHILYIRMRACHWVLLTFLKVSLLHLALGNKLSCLKCLNTLQWDVLQSASGSLQLEKIYLKPSFAR